MADPRARITSGLRGLSAAPPPRPPRTKNPAAGTARADRAAPPGADRGGDSNLHDSTGADPATPPTDAVPPTRRRRARSAASSSDNLPGRAVGNKRSLVAHLPAKVRDTLDAEVEQLRTTKGIVIMRALRDHHHNLRPRTARSARATGPFPPERRVRRRLTVPHCVPTTYTLWLDECEALVQVADRLDVNLSELVTDALLLRYDISLDDTA
jgi:hypothetical protein